MTDQGESTSISTDEAQSKIESLLGDDGTFGTAPEPTEEDEPVEASEPVEEPEEEPEAEADEAEPEEELAPITTLEELAQALEKSPDELDQSLKVTIKAAGQIEQVTLAELKAGYQKDAHFRQSTQQLAEQRKAFEERATYERQQLEAALTQNAQVLQAVEQLVITPPNPEEMARLRAENPAEWAARIQEFNARQAYIQQLRQAGAQAYEQNRNALQQREAAQRGEMLQREREKLAEIPGWNDELKNSIVQYLTNQYQYTGDEIGNVYDHRLIDIVRKAHLYDAMQTKVDVASKKVKTFPQLVKPGKAETKGTIKHSALAEAKARLKKTGSRHDAARLIESLL